MIRFEEITKAFTEMIELPSMSEPEGEWAQVDGIDSDAIDEWAEKWAKARGSWRKWAPLITATSPSPRGPT